MAAAAERAGITAQPEVMITELHAWIRRSLLLRDVNPVLRERPVAELLIERQAHLGGGEDDARSRLSARETGMERFHDGAAESAPAELREKR